MVEAGTKSSFFAERLTSTVSLYDIRKDNVPVTDENNPGFSVNGGELRSQGFEVDVAGELGAGFQIVANYAYTDTEVLRSTSLPVGSRFSNVPLHSGSVWLSYDLRGDSRWQGLRFAGGLSGASARLGNSAGTFELDGYLTADAAVSYQRELAGGRRLLVRLNVLNLLDEEYYESASGTASVFPGRPRSFVGTVSMEF